MGPFREDLRPWKTRLRTLGRWKLLAHNGGVLMGLRSVKHTGAARIGMATRAHPRQRSVGTQPIVRGGHVNSETKPIVVGVDGSEEAGRALVWAADDARRRGVPLRLVSTWTYPAFLAPFPYQPPINLEDFEQGARSLLDKTVEDAGAALDGLTWEASLVEGPAALRLVEAAHDATLLVVGSRGRGGFKGLLLGSVSQHVAAHSTCPVVIVH